ncbi:MAG TPA: Holliday junction resolvase RuvX [Vulgatibacter sp.]|nr:Holliday junction resolvase RuvX [Vulgatibacter sp.]
MGFMALDLGDKTIGVATSNELGWTTPVETIRRKGIEADLAALARLVEEHEPERIVVGLPLNMDDSEGPRAARSRKFAAVLRERFGLPVALQDERLSTFEAEQRLAEAGVPAIKRKAIVDMVAAQVILEAYLAAGAPPPDAA